MEIFFSEKGKEELQVEGIAYSKAEEFNGALAYLESPKCKLGLELRTEIVV